MKYKAIGFDYGGVINGKPGTHFNKAICQLLDITEEDYRRVYFSHNRKFNAGKPISEQELWASVLSDLDRSDQLDNVMKFVADMRVAKQTNQEVLELIDRLRAKGYKTGLLSNNNQQAADKMRTDGLDKHFDVFIVSAEVGVMKPDPEIFNLFAERLGVKLPELVFIDDSKRSLSASEECGFAPVLFESYEQLVKELSKRGVFSDSSFKVPPNTTVNDSEYKPDSNILPFAPELVEFISKNLKLTTYRLGDKYDYLQTGDVVTIQNSATGEPIHKAKITNKSKATFAELPLDDGGHEAYESKEHQREVFSGYYKYIGREIKDEDSFLVISFELVE